MAGGMDAACTAGVSCACHVTTLSLLLSYLRECQFTTATSHPELDKCYGVGFCDKVNEAVNSEDAKSFLEGEGSVEK